MIAWKCDYGYLKENASVFNENNIVITDVNKYYSIITISSEVENIYPAISGQLENIYGTLENIFGKELLKVYGPIGVRNDVPFYTIINKYFPSFYAMAPNLMDAIEENINRRPFMRIHSTGYYFLFSVGFSATTCVVYDKNFTVLISGDIGRTTPEGCTMIEQQSITNCRIAMGFQHSYSGVVDINKIGTVVFGILSTNGYISIEKNTFNSMGKQIFAYIYSIPPDVENNIPPYDPYAPGGNSTEGDNPPGTFDKTSDPIPDSPLPTLSMADTGFTRIYNPTLAQVQSLAQYLWKTEDIFETLWNHIKQSFENPMDVMIAFNIVPVAVPNGGTSNFSIMYIDTGVQLTKAANQFVDVDCGTLTLQGYYGSALDYSPYTKIQCYLPFIGMVNLDPDEVMNTTLQIKYRVDIVSGGCVAKILVDGNCLYQYSGHCSISVPFSAADFSSYMNAMLRVASLAVGSAGAAIGGAVGAAAALGAGEAAQQTSRIVNRTTITNTQRNPDTGRQIITGTQQIIQEQPVNENQSGTQASFAGLTPANVSNTVGAVMSSKAGILHAGSFNGNTGYLGVRYPYLIITTPRQCLPASYQTMNGYPAMITMTLGSCTGFTQVQQVTLTGMDATNPEQAEILSLLKGGVIF